MTGSPDNSPRYSSARVNSDLEDEGLVKAFEIYKKKDTSKGTLNLCAFITPLIASIKPYYNSRCALQRRRERSNYETEHVQDYSY